MSTDGVPTQGSCARSLVEYLPEGSSTPAPPATTAILAATGSTTGAIPAPRGAAWGPPTTDAAATPQLSILAPEHDGRIWRNPELPAPLNRLALRAATSPGVAQVVWYVDGEPFALTDPARTVYWPLRPGAHRFQLRLPGGEVMSRPVRIVVE